MSKFLFIFILLAAQSAHALGLLNGIGVRGRLGTYGAHHKIETEQFTIEDDDQDKFKKFPVMLAFRPTNRGWTFSQWFIDFESPSQSLNMQATKLDRTSLFSNYLTAAEQNVATANTNWSMTADFKTWSGVLGYQWGVYLPYSDSSRWLKASIGLTVGWFYYNISLYQCSSFTVSPERRSGSKKSSGICADKTFMDNIKYNGIGVGGTIAITLYEYYKKDKWQFQFATFDIGSISAFSEKKLGNRPGTPKLKNQTNLISADFFNATYFF